MPPVIRFTKEAVLNAAYQLVRREGPAALNARAVAKELGGSTQPIFRAYTGMDELQSDVIRLADDVIRTSMRERTLDPFRRKLTTQDGRIISDGSRRLSPDELLRMDWLCHNVIGSIPTFDELLPMSQSIVRELGVYKDKIPAIKEATL